MKFKFPDKQLFLISLFCFFALLVYLKANDDPIMPIMKDTMWEVVFQRWDTGSSLVKDLCIGILVSTIFWIFIVYLPENNAVKAKKKRLNRALFLIIEACGGNPWHWDKHYIHCKELSFEDLPELINIKKLLDKGELYGGLGEKAFFETCYENYEIFRFLSIAANEISPEHGALWDSITRNITRIGKQYPDWVDARKKDGCRVGVDYSSGALWLNLTEILESGEKWLKL